MLLLAAGPGAALAAAAPPCNGADPACAALSALWYATGGAGWEVSTGWVSGVSGPQQHLFDGVEAPAPAPAQTLPVGGNHNTSGYCGWYGVTCRSGTVVRIRLDDNSLEGTIPPALFSSLPSLEQLDLARAQPRPRPPARPPRAPPTAPHRACRSF